MAEAEEIDRLPIVTEDADTIVTELNKLLGRIESKLRGNSTRESRDHISLFQVLLGMRKSITSLCDDLIKDRMPDPATTVSHMWRIIEMYSDSSETVIEGTYLLERFFKLKIRSTIKPRNYLQTIKDYVQWQHHTIQCFVEQFHEKPRDNRLAEIIRLWDWNNRANEGMFFGGAARPLHVKIVTDFSALMSIYYDRLWPLYKENRDKLPAALYTLLHEESEKYWPDYEIFPCTASQTIIDKCFQYFYFQDRHNTWFINSSGSDYIPFVNSAREIFAEKFCGANMSSPDQHREEWILKNLKKRCLDIYRSDTNNVVQTIIILLTSKNRFGYRIDVDYIHLRLNAELSNHVKLITIVDGCQDGVAHKNVDLIVYTKRFTTTGAMAVVNKEFLLKNPMLRNKLTAGVNFPISILAQIYINLNMMNTGLVYGIEELVNSSRWDTCQCSIRDELDSAMNDLCRDHSTAMEYSFTEDPCGTILILVPAHNKHVMVPKLWAFLKKEGHSLDCFAMDNPYLQSQNGINSDDIRELIDLKSINALRQIEARSSDYLAWPLVPYWVTEPDDIVMAFSHDNS
ncbi:hypothetical protein I4U23_017819 [Adineta vaga]|nr:hypothetical protein I4U23_017819 [Adineta vaga]